MPKLVLLSPGMTGRAHDLKVEKTTIGRLEDNMFQIAEPSVSSHHCEVLLKGGDIVVRDLNSTNGTFIGADKVSGEGVLKPGQVLRLGQIEMRLETDTPPSSGKKSIDTTMVMQRGVSLGELEKGGSRGGFDTASKGFSKKDNKVNKIFWAAVVVFGLLILGLIIFMILMVKS